MLGLKLPDVWMTLYSFDMNEPDGYKNCGFAVKHDCSSDEVEDSLCLAPASTCPHCGKVMMSEKPRD